MDSIYVQNSGEVVSSEGRLSLPYSDLLSLISTVIITDGNETGGGKHAARQLLVSDRANVTPQMHRPVVLSDRDNLVSFVIHRCCCASR